MSEESGPTAEDVLKEAMGAPSTPAKEKNAKGKAEVDAKLEAAEDAHRAKLKEQEALRETLENDTRRLKIRVDKLAKLPAIVDGGVVTAGNASGVTSGRIDGAPPARVTAAGPAANV